MMSIYYSFQHIWFNGTAGGAIYSEFNVLPVTQMQMITASSFNIMEGDNINFEFAVHDLSHDDRWAGAVKNVEWDLEPSVATLQYDDPWNDMYQYSGVIDVDIGAGFGRWGGAGDGSFVRFTGSENLYPGRRCELS